MLTYNEKLKTWLPGSAAGDFSTAKVVSGQPSDVVTIPASGELLIDVLIEGVEISYSFNSATLAASFTPTGASSASSTDTVKMTVSFVDVDVDSNNNEGFGNNADTEDDKIEGVLEEDPTLPGKYVGVNDDDSNADGAPDLTQGFGATGPATTAVTSEAFTPMRVYFNEPFNLNVAIVRGKFDHVTVKGNAI
jgi:hypothetical protein